MAMADGFIAGWNVRYHYNFWRPVTAIRDAPTPTAIPATASVIRRGRRSSTRRPIPDYPSTHSVLGGAAAAVLAEAFGADRITFTMVSGPPFAGISE